MFPRHCRAPIYAVALILAAAATSPASAQQIARSQVVAAMRKAATFYREHVASHGGYVYHYSLDLTQRWGEYSLDLTQRWGEGLASEDQIWVQPPGTPTVGMAFLKAHAATGEPYYLDAAREAAEALVYGQVRSGGWTNCIDFNPRGTRVALYRNGKGRGRNTSSLDDGQTPSAIQFLVLADEALGFEHKEIHESVRIALDALLAAQFPNGAFPQVWDEDVVPNPPIMKANYPTHDWRTEGRIKNYWDMYTLNDNVAGYVAQTLIEAHRVYKDDKYMTALERLGDFLILAQMPGPQPGWAQQYNYQMQPIWARKFEPPGISGDETQEAIETLMRIHTVTGNRKYLEPIPRALAWLKRSRLRDGRLARYYELKTNKPLYMTRRGKTYSLTYDDANLPTHYGWKTVSRIDEFERNYETLKSDTVPPIASVKQDDVRRVISTLDSRGRWITTATGERLVGQPKIRKGDRYLSSARFSANLTLLSESLASP